MPEGRGFFRIAVVITSRARLAAGRIKSNEAGARDGQNVFLTLQLRPPGDVHIGLAAAASAGW
jgi:hypothetical protein